MRPLCHDCRMHKEHKLTRNLMFGVCAVMFTLSGQDTKPSCNQCSAAYISHEELQAYLKRAPARAANSVSDQQVRAVDIGKSHVDIGVVYRSGTQAEGAA